MGMFDQKVVFITGGASGLGRILVDEFVKENANVFFTYRNSEEKAREIIERYGERVWAVKADASDITDVKKSINECADKFGTIDVLINKTK